MSNNIVMAATAYANTATEKISNLFSPVSAGFHQSMSSAPPQKPHDAASYGDNYTDISVSTYEAEK